jgi:hypothetical protein
MSKDLLNALGRRVRDSLLRKHPEWAAYADVLEGGDLELAVPAPPRSRAKHLVIFTARGDDIWVRYAPPRMSYCVESEGQMHAVIEALLQDEALFAVVTNGDDWIETTLLRPGEELVLADGHVANVVSWSGNADRIVMHTTPHPAQEPAVFVRLVTGAMDPDSRQPQGILQAAYELRGRSGLSGEVRKELAESIEWFQSRLPEPDRLVRTRSKGFYRRRPVAISWFKREATEFIERAEALGRVIAAHGIDVRRVETTHPGYVVYEDAFQVVTVPFRDR